MRKRRMREDRKQERPRQERRSLRRAIGRRGLPAAAWLLLQLCRPGAAAEPPAGPPSDAEVDARFRCPETYTGAEGRAAAEEDFRHWVAARHPTWNQQQSLARWRRLLDAHHCAPVLEESLVVSSRSDTVGDVIVPSLGATVHRISAEEIESLPQGDEAPLQQVLLRNPGVVQDSFGEIHVRGEHGDVQYRVNGILLPESLNGFAQELDTHLVAAVSLTDGSLPAELGFRNAGVIDVTTKTGAQLRGGEVGLYGGGSGTVQPSVQVGTDAGPLAAYLSAAYRQTGLGVENPTASSTALHDDSTQGRGFGYLTYQLDSVQRLSVLASATSARFQIPDTPGLTPRYTVAGAPPPDSGRLDEHQGEENEYGVVSYSAATAGESLQAALFGRYGRIAFTPDLAGDLAFGGVASRVDESFLSNGLQLDASRVLGEQQVLRGGLLITRESSGRVADSAVFANGQGQGLTQLSDVPVERVEHEDVDGLLAGVYLEDEWRPLATVTVNAGLRYDRAAAILHESQLSPRLNGVWRLGAATTVHAGYARYFTPPTLQYIPPSSVALFAGTTNAPQTTLDSPPRSERADYYDLGLTRQLAAAWQVSLDAFDKQAENLIDLGQFGNAIILAPFNYRVGRVHGAELSTKARLKGLSLYANAGYVFTQARDIVSAQFEFPVAELAYIATHDIRLDHEGEVSATAGAAYDWRAFRAFVNVLYCSGLRSGFANLQKLPAYEPLNLGVSRTFPLAQSGLALQLRLDLLNVFDEVYQIRNGTGVGIAASQYGPRRTAYGGAVLLF